MWEFFSPTNQKNPRVRKIFVRNSGAGNGCANFMGAWKNAFFLQDKTHVHKIPRFRNGGVFWVLGEGGSANFIFIGARSFLNKIKAQTFRAKFRSNFVRKSVAREKKDFVPTTFCRRATLMLLNVFQKKAVSVKCSCYCELQI